MTKQQYAKLIEILQAKQRKAWTHERCALISDLKQRLKG